MKKHLFPIGLTAFAAIMLTVVIYLQNLDRIAAENAVEYTVIMLLVVVAILIVLMVAIISLSYDKIAARAEAKARAEFLASMSREIRTPLNAIIGLNHLMQVHLDDPEKLEYYLKKSANTEQDMLALINDIIDFQKIRTGKLNVIEAPFSLKTLIANVESVMRDRMNEKRITFQITCQAPQDKLIGDGMRIRQILLNILVNACRYTDEDGQVDFSIVQKQEPDGTVTTKYRIEDGGCCTAKKFQDKVFELFSQETRWTENSMKGMGFGMNISYLLSKQMGGELVMENRSGQGSCVTLVLKNKIADGDAVEGESGNSQAVEQKLRSLNILLAEDNELSAEILMELLIAEGHTVNLASDGEEVVALFKGSPAYFYDLILMDVQMPKRNGCDAAKMIRMLEREDAKSVLIYACTANTFREDMELAAKAGMNDFIAKPVDIAELMEKLKKAM